MKINETEVSGFFGNFLRGLDGAPEAWEKRQAEMQNEKERRESVDSQRAAAEARASEDATYRRSRLRLFDRGIPAKDVEMLVAGLAMETPALVAARAFLADAKSRILVLSGPRGLGKTTAASWIIAQGCPDQFIGEESERQAMRYLNHEEEKPLWPPWPYELSPRMVDVTRLLRVNRYNDEAMKPWETCSMLAIDDLGIEFSDEKGSFLVTLDGLINARYSANLRTIITTNVTVGDFKQRYGERIVDRIRECGKFVGLIGDSLRAKPAVTP